NGPPDLEVLLRLGDDVAPNDALRLDTDDRKLATLTDVSVRKRDAGRLVLGVGKERFDLMPHGGPVRLSADFDRAGLVRSFRTMAGEKGFVTAEDVAGFRGKRLRGWFDAADRDGDGKLTLAELEAALDLHERVGGVLLTLNVADEPRG